jgi:acyl carrier protein
MNDTDILNAIAKIVEEVTGFDSAEVTTEKSFTDDLEIDSLSMVEITVQVEDRFEVRITDDQVAELRPVGDAVSYIANHRCLLPDGLAVAPLGSCRSSSAGRLFWPSAKHDARRVSAQRGARSVTRFVLRTEQDSLQEMCRAQNDSP